MTFRFGSVNFVYESSSEWRLGWIAQVVSKVQCNHTSVHALTPTGRRQCCSCSRSAGYSPCVSSVGNHLSHHYGNGSHRSCYRTWVPGTLQRRRGESPLTFWCMGYTGEGRSEGGREGKSEEEFIIGCCKLIWINLSPVHSVCKQAMYISPHYCRE